MTTAEQKKLLRENLRAQRDLLTEQEVKKASEEVCARLSEFLGVPAAKKMHVYAAKEIWNEINIAPYIDWLKDQNHTLEIDVATHAPIKAIPSEQYDIVLVPVLGFDASRRRLGMGMGWYDMFLGKQQHALKVGIAYDWAEMNELIFEEHDVPMDVIVTPTRTLT